MIKRLQRISEWLEAFTGVEVSCFRDCRGSIYLFYSWSIPLIAFVTIVSSISLPFVSSIHAV